MGGVQGAIKRATNIVRKRDVEKNYQTVLGNFFESIEVHEDREI